MATVLVTGGTGFIGSWVTRRLVEQGVRVICYSRNPDTRLLKDITDKITFISGDIMDLPTLICTLKEYKVDRVIHLATMLMNALDANPFLAYRINVDGSINILEACRLMSIERVVCASSKSVYDLARGEYGHPTYKPIDEDYPKEPPTIYGATKFFMENMGLSYHRLYDLDFVALRFATVYGVGKQVRHRIPTHGAIIESGMLGKPFRLPQDADQKDDIVYNKDIANGIVLACFAGKLEHRIFHLGTGKAETLRHIIETVSEIFGPVPVQINPEAARHLYCSVFDISRARRELGYAPEYDLARGVRDYLATMKQFDIKPLTAGSGP